MDRCAIYARISVDLDGRSTATARQLEDCRRLAEARGWQVTGVYEDPDVSAYRKKARPAFEEMKAAIGRGEIDVVLAWKIDRLARRSRDFAELDELCERHAARIVTVTDGIDTGTSAGRVVSTIMTALARAESENISIRGKRKNLELARDGVPWGRGRRAFGYTTNRRELVPHEAALVRDAAQRVLAGDGLYVVWQDWLARDVRTPRGAEWSYGMMQRLLSSEHLCALRTYAGQSYSVEAPAILSVEEHEQLVRILARKVRGWRSGRLLLTGILVCGRCNATMVSRPTKTQRATYVCAKRPGVEACGRMARAAQPLEDHVRDAIFAAVEDPALLAAMVQNEGSDEGPLMAAAIREDEARLEALARDYYADQLLSRAEFLSARDALVARLEAARKALSGLAMPTASVEDIAALSVSEWATRPVSWRRGWVERLIERIVIQPAVIGRKAFDPTKVGIVWRW